jgi:hypothetical protein
VVVPTEVNATAVGEANVKNGQVKVVRIKLFGFSDAAGLGDHGEILVGFEEITQTPSHDFVVINE